jgi:hypothetical protein
MAKMDQNEKTVNVMYRHYLNNYLLMHASVSIGFP